MIEISFCGKASTHHWEVPCLCQNRFWNCSTRPSCASNPGSGHLVSLAQNLAEEKSWIFAKGFFISVQKNVPFPFPYLDRSSKLPRKHARVGYMLWTRTKYKTEAGSIGSCSILIKNIFKLKMFWLTVAGFQLQSERFLLSFHLKDENICSQPQKPQMHILAKWPSSFSWKRPQAPASQVFK